MYFIFLNIFISIFCFFVFISYIDIKPYTATLCSCYGVFFAGNIVVEQGWCRLERRQWRSIGYGGAGVVAGIAFLAGVRRDLVFFSILIGLCVVADWALRRVGVLPLLEVE